jgi:phosphoglucomutase
MLSENIMNQAKHWAESEVFDNQTRDEVRKMLKNLDYPSLEKSFSHDLEFGTGGVRALTGVGNNRLNIYTIKKITCAYAQHLGKKFTKNPIKVAISYDTRVHSKKFAQACAEVLVAYGIKVYLTKQSRPTPLLSYLVRDYKCQGGICITASHNPSDYNGYKIFNSYGSQVVPPEDFEIICEYKKIKSYENIKSLNFSTALDNQQVVLLDKDFDQKYLQTIAKERFFSSKHDHTIVYTPLHGVGGSCVPGALKLFGFDNVYVVKSQDDGNGLFPSVLSPNPEDPRCFSQAKKLGEKVGATILVANDPDADRFSLCVKSESGWRYLDGQELSALLGEFILANKPTKSGIILKTIVTSDLLLEIAEHYQVKCIETSIGFKWIGDYVSQTVDNSNSAIKFLGAFEESLGFLLGSHARDKDGVLGAALACEMVVELLKTKGSIDQALDELYLKYNYYYHQLQTINLSCSEKGQADQAMTKLRSGLFVSENLIEVFDYLKDFKKKDTCKITKSNMLTLMFADNIKVTIRPSGTEPKLKLYGAIKVKTKGLNIDDLTKIKAESKKKINNILLELSDFIDII